MRAAILCLALASCYTDINGDECLWAPGGDGTCPNNDDSGTHYDPPPPHVGFSQAALAPGHAIVLQTGDEGRKLWHAPLDPRGLPTQELREFGGDSPEIELWPGPDGTALLTTSDYGPVTGLLLDADGQATARIAVTSGTAYVDVVFDGEAYLVVWIEHGELRLRRIWPDGTVGPIRVLPIDGAVSFKLATDGAGGAVLSWSVELTLSSPRQLRALTIIDGEPTTVETIAADGERCLDATLALVHARDGYHVLAMRRPCQYTPDDPPLLVDIRLDGTEQPSTLGLAAVPTGLVTGRCSTTTVPSNRSSFCAGFLAHDHSSAWFVDDLLTTATPALWPADVKLLAVTSTAIGYVAAFDHDDQVDLVRIDPVASDRVKLAEGYYLDGGGCNAGGGAALAPVLALVLLLYAGSLRRRWRTALVVLALAGCTDDGCPWFPSDESICNESESPDVEYDPPPPRVSFGEAALAPNHAIVRQTGAEGERMWHAPLDARGLPEQDLAELVGTSGGSIARWPGPDGTALLTTSTYQDNKDQVIAVLLDASGSPSAPMIVTESRPYQLEVVFDGEAYLAVWRRSYYSNDYELRRIFPNGVLGPLRIPPVSDTGRMTGDFALATDGAGGAVFARSLVVGAEQRNLLQATRIVDGKVVELETIATDDDETYLGSDVSLVFARDGYHVLTTRGTRGSGELPIVVDVRLDGTERRSTLRLAYVPAGWVRHCPTPSNVPSNRSSTCGFLAYGRFEGGWFVDDALTTATPAPWPADATLMAVTSTEIGYVAAFGHDDQVDLVRIDPVADDRVKLAESYDLPESGCNAGGGAALAPALVVVLLYASSPRRRWRKRRSGSDPARSSAAR